MKGKISDINASISISFEFGLSETPKSILLRLLYSQPEDSMVGFLDSDAYNDAKAEGDFDTQSYSIGFVAGNEVTLLDWNLPLRVQLEAQGKSLKADGDEIQFVCRMRHCGYWDALGMAFGLVAPALRTYVMAKTYSKQVTYSTAIQMELSKRFNFNKGDLAANRVLMIGAGTLGNEIAKNLVFSGIQDLTIVDLDKYEYWNLPRSPMITEADVGRPKALALAQRMAERSPFAISITGIDADITMLGWGFFKDFDLILSPVDSLGIRYYVDRGCKLYNKTHITAATGLLKYPYERMVGDIIISPAGSKVCYACTEQGGAQEIRKRVHCGDGYSPETQPQVMGFSSTIAGIASSIAVTYLLGKFQSFKDDNSVDQASLYWKYSLAEVGMIYKETEAYNLRAVKSSKQHPYCTFHSGSDILKSGEVIWEFGEYGKKQLLGEEAIPIITISNTTSANDLVRSIAAAYGDKATDAYLLDLEGWSMLFYSVYKTKSRAVSEDVRSDAPTVLVDGYLDVAKFAQKLPREHVYRITPDGYFTNAWIIKLVISN
jgi:molybdopterin/thiamine biosynthesis adenylyltransferase